LVGSYRGRLRVGVIGLGRLWEARHKPALLKLRDRFQVVAVFDQVARRAEIEAGNLGCAAVAGVRALVERADVDVIHVLSPQWFGLHPIELACEVRKPVYCALPLAAAPEEVERVGEVVESSGVPFMPEFARRFYPATLRLRELLATRLGKPRLVLGHARLFGFDRYASPGPATQLTPVPIMVDPGSYLIDWCGFLFQSAPETVRAIDARLLGEGSPAAGPATQTGPDFASFGLSFPGGGLAEISMGRYHRPEWGDASRFLPPSGFQVYAERGAAWVELPDRVQWSDGSGIHDERLPVEPTVGEVLNDHFHRLVHGESALAPTVRDALSVSRLVSAAGRSRSEGRTLPAG
jgi:predicted dehydrogenase